MLCWGSTLSTGYLVSARTFPRRDGSIWLAFILIGTIGCGSDEVTESGVVRDSMGVRITEHPGHLTLTRWALSPEPEAVIGGGIEEEPAYQFTEIRGAVRLSDGRIVVADWGTKEARYYTPEGEHLRTVGGGGEGPGEVRFLFAVDRAAGDTLIVGGWPIGSRYWFDEHGDFIRNQMLGPWFPGMLGRTLVDGSLLLDTYEFGSYGNTLERWAARGPDGELRPEGIVERVSRDGSRIDTIGVIRGQTFHKSGVPRQNLANHALPFSPIGLVAWSRDRIFVGHTEVSEVQAFTLEGDLSTIIRWVADSVAVTRADRTTFAEEVIANLRNPNLAPNYRRWLSEITYPDFKPTFAALIADEDGFLWIRDQTVADAPVARWTVYGPDGLAVAHVDVPGDVEILDVDATHIIGKKVGDLGLETIVTYRVLRQGSPTDSE